ncbi:glycosyltransferase [Paenibacillus sp. PR3]|uniref:Glycosyltransferase n=1 Tax=Paenibacillus terricola TaxID=2763503 RepID=A0ABR8MXI8_9BACL|nr:glycosyltransferase family 2 protein [Paenibacillus terricola]MBD3920672.1 glycosyltransferase [Paenibacillus terricola]
MLLGVHLIVRNEELHLAQCLDSIRQWADELIVVDTGSSDQTVQIAASRGAHIVHMAWADDFAQARNFGIGQARTLWVLVLDADERLADGTDMLQLRNKLLHSKETAYRVVVESTVERQCIRHEAVRLFRADQGYRYVGAIHEQLATSVSGAWRDVDGPLSDIRLQHHGYEPGELARKRTAERNGCIIRKLLEGQPDNPFHWYNLGVTLSQQAKAAEASAAFARARAIVSPDAPFRPSLMLDSARALLASGEEGAALELLTNESKRYINYADLQLLYGECLERQGAWLEAKQAYTTAIEASQVDNGLYLTESDVNCRACTALAGLERRLGNQKEAARRYEQALLADLGWPEALEGLAELLHEAGGSDSAIAQTLVRYAGLESKENRAGDARAERNGVEKLRSLAHALTLIGAYSSAVPLWRQAVVIASASASEPADAVASFSACLIRTGQYAEAAEVLASMARDMGSLPMTAGMDWALCSWMEGRRLPLSAEHLLDASTLLLCQAAERRLLGHRQHAAADASESGEAVGSIGSEGGADGIDGAVMLMERAVSHGLLRIAERLAGSSEERFAVSLHRHGYTTAAADRLLRMMGTGHLGARGLRTLGEMLYGRQLYSESLSLYERAVQHQPDDEHARLGAASASIRLAVQALTEREEERSAAAWLTEERKRLEMAVIRLESLGWRTMRSGAQRRRMSDGGAAEADFLMHDREG